MNREWEGSVCASLETAHLRLICGPLMTGAVLKICEVPSGFFSKFIYFKFINILLVFKIRECKVMGFLGIFFSY